MKKKTIFILLFLILAFSLFSLAASAQTADPTLDGLNATANGVDAFKGQTTNFQENFLQTKAGQLISTVLSFVGVLFFILMIYAGVLWMTSQGNEQQVSKAKELLRDAIIGIIIVFAAYALTAFLGNAILQ